MLITAQACGSNVAVTKSVALTSPNRRALLGFRDSKQNKQDVVSGTSKLISSFVSASYRRLHRNVAGFFELAVHDDLPLRLWPLDVEVAVHHGVLHPERSRLDAKVIK